VTLDTAGITGLASVSFVVGIMVGVLLRDAFEIARTGKGFLMSQARTTGRRLRVGRRPSLRTVGIGLIVASLHVNAAVGFLLLGTRARVDNLTSCIERYNRENGDARDTRDAVAKSITTAEIVLWEAYVDAFDEAIAADSAGDEETVARLQTEFRDRAARYAKDLRKLNATRYANPYPDPDLCRRLVP
jgi:hypothetical protein